jgi:hypothetical protein
MSEVSAVRGAQESELINGYCEEAGFVREEKEKRK